MLERTASEMAGPDSLTLLAAHCTPLVIRGLYKDWPVVQRSREGATASLDYLAAMASDESAEYFSAPATLQGRYHYGAGAGGFNFDRAPLPVREALDRILANAESGERTGYMGSLPAGIYFPAFAQDNVCPILAPEITPRIWVGNPSTVACHYDRFDNLACVAAGRRRFTLYPPEAIGDLYVGPIDHTLSGQPVSMVGGDAEGGAFPRFAQAKAQSISVMLEEGDALYLPKLWWHEVEALDPVNILVNYWWDGFSSGPDSPYAAMMLAMIAIAERPERERAAWRAYFDHYVFRPDRHPLAHLPQSRHGVLGPLASGNYARIRTLVMRMLRGG